MAALYQIVLMRLALCGLAVSLLVLGLRSRIARDTFARLLSIWRSLTAFGRVAVCSFLLIGDGSQECLGYGTCHGVHDGQENDG